MFKTTSYIKSKFQKLPKVGFRKYLLISIIAIIIISDFFIIAGLYKARMQRMQAQDITMLSDIIYLLDKISVNYEKLPDDYIQFTTIVRSLEENTKLKINLTDEPLFDMHLNNTQLCSIATAPNKSEQDMREVIALKLQTLNPKAKGVSFLLQSIRKWVNIEIPDESHQKTAIPISLVLVISSLLLAYLLSIYNLHKPWNQIKQAVYRLGLINEDLTMPIYGPNIVKSFSSLMDKVVAHVEQLIREKTLSMAALSHDIRTPLTKLKMLIELMDDTAIQHKLLLKVDEINFYLQQVLDHAKENYQQEPKHTLDVVALTEAVCNDFIDAGLPVTLDSVAQHFPWQAQPIGLSRALSNLINNAINYGKCAKVSLTIKNAQTLCIIVADQGPGLPAAELAKVFEPFYRFITPNTAKVGGTGLGLASVKNIIEYNGASVHLESGDPIGLRAVITFTGGVKA